MSNTNITDEEMAKYTEEARQRWGDTEAFKQSQERVQKMGKEGLNKVMEESQKLTLEIAKAMSDGESPSGERAQKLIAKHFDGLHAFYEPSVEMYRGLANMYIEDERFKMNYENVAPGLAQFMHDAMIAYCDAEKNK